MLVVFEGVDKSGKSTLSLLFEQYLNDEFRDADGLLRVDPHLGDFSWTKEPTFTSEEADQLNSPQYESPYKRERLFFESRLRHQDMLSGKNIICDRYVWSGMAYALQYSPDCYEFAKELYLSDTLFIAPDLYVFVDTPPEVCFDRDPRVDLERLRALRQAYEDTRIFIEQPVITVQSIGGEQRSLDLLVEEFEKYAAENKPLVEEHTW